MMQRYLTQFERVKKGALFSKNGNRWRKRSSRTAEITKPEIYAGRWFYFSQREPVEITDLGVIENDY